jgi:NADH pyrophosphatase NudC (nudix superfamily)
VPDAPLGYCGRCGTVLESQLQFGKQRPTCPSCGNIVFEDPKVAVAILIERDGKLLLGRRNINPGKGSWSFTAGYVDRGEVVEIAAVREVQEEVGCTVRLTELIGVYSEQGNPVVLVVYSATVAEGEPTADGDEVTEVGWFAPQAMPEMAFPHDRRIVADWLQRQSA